MMARAMTTRLAVLATLAACAGGEHGLLVRSDPASAAVCPHGGTVVSSGRDDNGDGALQEDEVAVRTPVCAPAPTPSEIVLRLRAEPPGDNCRGGGTAVQSGIDSNSNGTLDDAEVAHIDYLCRDAVVTRVAAEPAGARCREGGVAFFAGIDRDGDGVLDDGEIDSTDVTCGDVVSRDVAIHSDAEAAALAPIRIITGALTVQLTQVRTLSLPVLERAGAVRVVDNPQLTRLSLPALQAIDGELVLRASGLTAVELPRLRRAGSLSLEMLRLVRLTGFAALDEVAGPVRIAGMPALVALELPQAVGIGDLSITGNPALVHVAWDVSDRIGRIDITGNPRLETIDLSTNTFFGGPVQVGAVAIASNPVLGHLALRARQAASFAIAGQPELTDIGLEVGRFARDVTVTGVAFPFHLGLYGRNGSMSIAGNLTIEGPVAQLDPGSLTVVGRFVLDGTRLTRVGLFSGSVLVGEALRISNNPQLIDLSRFALVGDLEVVNNAALTSLDLERMRGDELGAVVLIDNPMLAAAPVLARVTRVHGAVTVERNPRLTALFDPALLRIEGPVRVRDNAGLGELRYPALELVGASLEVSANAALQALVLPALPAVAGSFTIADNAQLHELDLASLARADEFRVDDNPRLPACTVLAIFARATGTHQQSGNDDAAICE